MSGAQKHTPGPWGWAPHDGYPSTDLIGGDGSAVLQIYESHGGGDMPNKSNARLIAEAPGMLAAFERILASDGMRPGHVEYLSRAEIAAIARDVIAKATGAA